MGNGFTGATYFCQLWELEYYAGGGEKDHLRFQWHLTSDMVYPHYSRDQTSQVQHWGELDGSILMASSRRDMVHYKRSPQALRLKYPFSFACGVRIYLALIIKKCGFFRRSYEVPRCCIGDWSKGVPY